LLDREPNDAGTPFRPGRVPDWAAIAAAVDPIPGTVTPTPGPASADPRLLLAEDLDVVGLRGQADNVRSHVIESAAANPVELVGVTRYLHERADASYTARAAATLLSSLVPGTDPPDDLLHLAYPPAYQELVEKHAEAEDIDDLLLYALMRQESLYDPDAGSSAGALGLTQVIPPTGESIAAELEVPDFDPEQLFRPDVSLRFGAHYLAQQIENFDGNLYHALAAYNGGPGATDDGIAAAGDDIDLFVESLEFDETRLYVRRVMEHYAWYRMLYEGLDSPSIPD
jgi:soluble lytic murein transglycosylase